MKISIVVFTLNEIDGMKVILPRIKKEWFDELIVIDGESTDGTIEFARGAGLPVYVQKEKGAGAAFLEAMKYASGTHIIPFSPDGNFIPEKIPELVKKAAEGYAVVTVSRYRNGAKSYDDDLVTAFGNKMFTGMINFLFGTRFTDSLYGYFIFQKSLVEELGIEPTSSWGPQLLIRAFRKKIRIGEIPGDEPRRIGGVRKMQPLKNGLDILRMIFREFFVQKTSSLVFPLNRQR